MKTNILMLGTFDTKGDEFTFLRKELIRNHINVLSMNVGTMDPNVRFPIDIDASTVAEQGGSTLELIRKQADRGVAVSVMCKGARMIVADLFAQGQMDGIIGMGGGGGTSIATAAMSILPVGVPKMCITTMASGDTRPFVRTKDILLFPSIVDISGVNIFSKKIISNAAAAMAGMAKNRTEDLKTESKKVILMSMFGNTTAAGTACRNLITQAGYDTLVFHSVGVGGQALEELTLGGYAAGVLDLTTTEWADELCGGICSAGNKRLDAPGEMQIPHVIVPGCIDMVNFGDADSIPARYKNKGRKFFQWAPEAVLMRTNQEENTELGRIFAEKANRAPKTTAFLVPLDGFSELGRKGGKFYDADADRAFLTALEKNLESEIWVETISCNINDAAFARKAVSMLLKLIEETRCDNTLKKG